MKKTLCIALALAMVFSIAACTQGAQNPSPSQTPGASQTPLPSGTEAQASFTPGKYTGSAQGHNGTIEVEVALSENAIVEITIVNNVETEHMSERAFLEMPKQMVAEQSLNVDSITGATVSSAGLKAAVTAAIKSSGGNIELLNKPSSTQISTETVALEADVVVVGAGGAGMATALSAEQNGLSVILLEKNGMVGGHTALSGGWTFITGSKLQSEKYGVTDDTVEKVYEDNFNNGGGKSVPELLQLFCEQMGAAADWSVDYVGAKVPDAMSKLAECKVDRAIIYTGEGRGISDALEAKVRQTSIDLHLDTRATALLMNGDTVVGVEAKGKDGTTYTIKAASTVLATGGYGARKDLLPAELSKFPYYGASLSTGDGLIMAQEIGADSVNMGYVEMFANGVEWMPNYAKYTGPASNAALAQSAILIDYNGKRVVNERGPVLDIVDVQKHNDGMLLMLMDQANYELLRGKLGSTGISLEMLDGWLAKNGQSTPIHAKGETLEALANTLGINADALKQTVERYNSFVEAGVDEDFGRTAANMPVKIGDGPYYILEQKARYATTLGGLLINPELQVVATTGDVISGLYAVGDTAGGVRGDDSISGADIGWAITSGHVLGQQLAK